MFKILLTVLSVLFAVLVLLESESSGPGAADKDGLTASLRMVTGSSAEAEGMSADALPAGTAYVRRDISVMAEPSADADVVATLVSGQQVHTARDDNPDWQAVVVKDVVGYVPGTALQPGLREAVVHEDDPV